MCIFLDFAGEIFVEFRSTNANRNKKIRTVVMNVVKRHNSYIVKPVVFIYANLKVEWAKLKLKN